jgi:hypothetical protein
MDPLQTAKGYAIRAVGFAICGGGRMHATGGGARPAHGGARRQLRRKFAGDGDLGATVHHSRRKMDKEKEEDGAELTRGSMTAVGRCRRRAAMRADGITGARRGGSCDLGCVPSRTGTASWGSCECTGEEGG